MFTDIEHSTELWERHQDEFRGILARHDSLVREMLHAWNGYEVKVQGDSFMIAFQRGTDAVCCALELQRALAAERWPDEIGELRVRIGVHTGEPFMGSDPRGRPDYFGPMVNRAARIAAAAHGGQIVVSSTTRDAVRSALSSDHTMSDLGRHRLRGLDQPEHLFEVGPSNLPSPRFPPLRTLDGARSNLPLHLTSFVGRQADLRRLRDLLSKPDVRLLTLTGPGGAGKTRLAQQLASECAGEYTGGVWMVDLSETPDTDAVLPQIASALGVTPFLGRDLRAQVTEFLSDRSLVLLLDNFERVLGASLLVAELLKAAAGLKCLVTSQIALRLAGEHLYPLGPMQLPEHTSAGPEVLLRSDAVALFLERSLAVRPHFQLTQRVGEEIAALCAALDGSPLGIELAAAQMGDLSPAEVLQSIRLEQDLIESESPDTPERHRTLGAAIEWSYKLLEPVAQEALQQFSVFAGGWFREAAQALCGPTGFAALRVLHRHSLVQSTEVDDGRIRYHLLGMVRNFARDRLSERLEAESAAARRHAEYYLKEAQRYGARLHSADEAAALRNLQWEIENVRAGMDWAVQKRDPIMAADYAIAAFDYLSRRGLFDEAENRTRAALQISESVPALHYNLASVALDKGLWKDAEAAARALQIHRDVHADVGVASSANLMGLIQIELEHRECARACFEEALDLYRSANDVLGIAKVLHNLGNWEHKYAAPDRAMELYQESLALSRVYGDRRLSAGTLNNLGWVQQGMGDLRTAAGYYRDCLRIYRDLDDPVQVAVALHNIAETWELDGRIPQAVRLFVHAQRIFAQRNSTFVSVSAEALARLREAAGPAAFERYYSAAQTQTEAEAIELALSD